MKRALLSCRHEAAVLEAARHGRLDEELRTHVRDCDACRAAAQTGAALREAAATFAIEAHLPDPMALLRRATEERRRLATERALRPLQLARGGAIAAAAGAAVGLLPRLLPHLHWPELAPLRSLAGSGWPTWLAMGALLITLVVGAFWLHWEEA
ncbi:MAG TPA: hypothetical protein VGS57_07525 [Thermoanaerobaculia bacterium]|jgi:hypothetical protein|nr:hypothetical protein [Thermoanaerobaculia bacterium]